jgi:hypothetical protein
VIEVPTSPDVAERLLILGAGTMAKFTPALANPPTVTTTFPVVAPAGTGTPILIALQLVGVVAVPLNVTVLEPWLDPKFVPVTVTAAPTAPVVGDRLVIPGRTVKATPLLATPFTVTTTFPVVALEGTGTAMLVALQLVGFAAFPLNVTVLEPCVDPKFVPVIVTDVPIAPEVADRLVIFGVGRTVKLTPLLATPPAAVTTTLPVVAPFGTVTPILAAPQDDTLDVVPLKVTVPVPCELPKFDPVTVTAVPTTPDVTDKVVMLGAAVTVNVVPPLATPPAAVTTTLPVVAPLGTVAVMLLAPQLVIVVAVVPLNFTLPFPTLGPKLDPAITIDDPTAPVFGVSEVMLGAAVTVNVTPALAWPPTVTTTLPVVAPLGTVAVILVAPQLVIVVAVVLLNLTVLPSCEERKLVPAITIEEPTAPVLGVKLLIVGVPVPVGNVICESKFPFSVPSMSSSPLNAVEEVPVRLTPTHK